VTEDIKHLITKSGKNIHMQPFSANAICETHMEIQ